MHRTEATNKAVDKFGSGKHGHRDRVVGPPLVPGTVVNADVVDNFEEIAKLLEFYGITLLTAGTETYVQLRDLVVGLLRGTIADPSPPSRTKTYLARTACRVASAEWEESDTLARSLGDFKNMAMHLDELPLGAVVTQIDVMWSSGSAAQTGSNRMHIDAAKKVFDWATPSTGDTALGSTVYADASSNALHTKSITGLSHTVSEDEPLWVNVNSGNAATSPPCLVRGFRVHYTNPYVGKR